MVYCWGCCRGISASSFFGFECSGGETCKNQAAWVARLKQGTENAAPEHEAQQFATMGSRAAHATGARSPALLFLRAKGHPKWRNQGVVTLQTLSEAGP